jgi:hypothetical protein
MKKYLVLILLAFIGFTSYAQTSNDADAQAFILACDADPAGKLTPDQKNYITQMVEGMKSIGVWDGMKAVYPMVGNTAFKNKFNLKDPRDLDVAFRLTFPNGATHDVNGILFNGTNQYANSFLNPTTVLANPKTNICLSFYITGGTGLGASFPNVMGGFGNGPTGNGNDFETILNARTTVSFFATGGEAFTGNFVFLNTPFERAYTLGTSKSGVTNLFKKGVKLASSVPNANGFAANTNIFLGTVSFNNAPAAISYQNVRLGIATIGTGLTDNQAQQLSHLIYYLQGILNRQ